jgi:ankyrin repeat protein
MNMVDSLDDSSAILRMVAAGDTDQVRRLLQQSPELVNATAPHPFLGGRPQPLHVAVEMDQREIFDLLLDAGADVNGSNAEYDHWSPLMLTIQRGSETMQTELLRRGARVGLVEALLLADDSRLDELLNDRDTLPSPVPNDGSWLQFARTTHAIDRLLALGASATEADKWGTTPVAALSKLRKRGQPLVRHLASQGIAVTAEDYARLGDQPAIEDSLRTGQSSAGHAPVLLAAVESRQLELARWLLEQGADANARATDRSRGTALHMAAWNGDLAMVELLVQAGADLAARDEEHHATALEWAETAVDITRNPTCQEVIAYLTGLTVS